MQKVHEIQVNTIVRVYQVKNNEPPQFLVVNPLKLLPWYKKSFSS